MWRFLVVFEGVINQFALQYVHSQYEKRYLMRAQRCSRCNRVLKKSKLDPTVFFCKICHPTAEANLLENQIKEAFRQFPEPRIESWWPAGGWEDTALWSAADLWITILGKDKRVFVIVVSIDWLIRLRTDPEWRGSYASEGPLIIVDKITGESIVHGISHFLDLESGPALKWADS